MATVMSSAVIQETVDPVWETDNSVVVRVPEQLGLTQEERVELQKKVRRRGGGAPPVREDVQITVEIFDWNRLGSGVFLGCVELRGQELEDFASGAKKNFQWFDLTKSSRLRQKDQRVPAQGQIGLMFGPREVEVEMEDDILIEFVICEAKELAKADT